MNRFSFTRLWAMIAKEFIQLGRDKPTFAMILAIPIIQLILFGFAINTNPKHLPTAIVNFDHSEMSRRILSTLEESSYFKFYTANTSEKEADQLLKRGKVQFVVNFPVQFSQNLVKGLSPQLLLQVDATDPAAAGSAISVFTDIPNLALKEELTGPLQKLNSTKPPFQAIVHTLYNPLAITAYNIVPGLLGVVLTMTMVVVAAQVITREFERGTMENLLATPVLPLEVMIGKIVPFIIVGYIQVLVILLAAKILFDIPILGSIFLLLILCLPFIGANLAVGITFSSLATSQLQAAQSATFFFLPSILLSGFMFPFNGMPGWAQWLGSILPLTHFLRIVRGILLKGNGFADVWQEVIYILLFMVVVLTIGLKRFRQTLD